jgi:uncharacterized repeat protein (TIGR01451 family)
MFNPFSLIANHAFKCRSTAMTNIIFNRHAYRVTASTAALLLAAASISPAYATIDNTATASGTYNGNTTTSAGDTETVPVVPGTPSLTVDKAAAVPTTNLGSNNSITDTGDTITFTYTVTNTGNVTLTSATPVDTGPTFGGAPGTGGSLSFTLTSAGGTTLDPGEAATFEAVYTLTQLDVLRAAGTTDAVSNTATASGTFNGNTTTSAGDTANTTITAGPALSVVKSSVINESGTADGFAAVGETITYTYTITNTGNVAMTGVTVNDVHEGQALASTSFTGEALVSDGPLASELVPITSTDAANNGIWDTLQPGAVITITYVHTVTQAEVDAQ